MKNWGHYQPARNCTGGPTPGARALQAWLDETYEGYSLGIYNCRSVRGSSTTSLHGEGRALDWGLKMPGPGRANPVGHKILAHLAAHGARLGIQCIIWDRRIYSGASPNGRYYSGVSPHYDHLHIELNWDGARDLTLATLRSVLGGAPSAPVGPLGSRLLRQGDKGPDVAEWQQLLRITADGDFGPATHSATVAFQQRHGLDADGVVGPATIAAARPRPTPQEDDLMIMYKLKGSHMCFTRQGGRVSHIPDPDSYWAIHRILGAPKVEEIPKSQHDQWVRESNALNHVAA